MRLAACAVAAALAGCVTTAAIVKRHDEVSLPLLIGATAADLVVIGVIAKEAPVNGGVSVGAAIATSLALTAVDVFVGCLIGACRSLRL
jgi:hypothetical protein